MQPLINLYLGQSLSHRLPELLLVQVPVIQSLVCSCTALEYFHALHCFCMTLAVALQGFYADFARVADDESRHLSWCLQRLQELGYSYGDMVAHSILWDGAQASSGEPQHCL